MSEKRYSYAHHIRCMLGGVCVFGWVFAVRVAVSAAHFDSMPL